MSPKWSIFPTVASPHDDDKEKRNEMNNNSYGIRVDKRTAAALPGPLEPPPTVPPRAAAALVLSIIPPHLYGSWSASVTPLCKLRVTKQ